jgi:hypothetical protein
MVVADQTINLSAVLASHVGLSSMARLRTFARWLKVATAGPTNGSSTRVFVAGSAMRTKAFNDVDLYLVYEDAEYAERYPLGYGGRVGEAWWFQCAAFGLLASQQTGLNIDFHITAISAMTISPKLEMWEA